MGSYKRVVGLILTLLALRGKAGGSYYYEPLNFTGLDDCLADCLSLRVTDDIVNGIVTCDTRGDLAANLLRCNHDCYEKFNGLILEAECTPLPRSYQCSEQELCEALSSFLSLGPNEQGKYELLLEYFSFPTSSPAQAPSPTFPPTPQPVAGVRRQRMLSSFFPPGSIFNNDFDVEGVRVDFFTEAPTPCIVTCNALLYTPESEISENEVADADDISIAVTTTVTVSVTATVGAGVTGGGAGAVTSGGATGLVTSIQTGGIDAAESAAEGVASTMKKEKGATVMSSMSSFSELQTTMSAIIWPYVGTVLQALTLVSKLLLVALSTLALANYAVILPGVERLLNPEALEERRFSDPELLPLNSSIWLGSFFVGSDFELSSEDELCSNSGINCVTEEEFSQDPIGPFLVTFLVYAQPGDAFYILLGSLSMDLTMAVVGMAFAFMLSILFRQLLDCMGFPVNKKAPKTGFFSESTANKFSLVLVIPSLSLALSVLIFVAQNNLYTFKEIGWILDVEANRTLKVEPVSSFQVSDARYAITQLPASEEEFCFPNGTYDDVKSEVLNTINDATYCNSSSLVVNDTLRCISYACGESILLNDMNWFKGVSQGVRDEIVVPNAIIDALLTFAELLSLAVVAVVYVVKKRRAAREATEIKAEELAEKQEQ